MTISLFSVCMKHGMPLLTIRYAPGTKGGILKNSYVKPKLKEHE